jgi:hypothetical protein
MLRIRFVFTKNPFVEQMAEREGFEPESPLPAKFRINADLVDC